MKHLFLISTPHSDQTTRVALDQDDALALITELRQRLSVAPQRPSVGTGSVPLASLIAFDELSNEGQVMATNLLRETYLSMAIPMMRELHDRAESARVYQRLFNGKPSPDNPQVYLQLQERFETWLANSKSGQGFFKKADIMKAAKEDIELWIKTTDELLAAENIAAVSEIFKVKPPKIHDLIRGLGEKALRGKAILEMHELCSQTDSSIDTICDKLGIAARSFKRDLVVERRISSVMQSWPPKWNPTRQDLRDTIATIQLDDQRHAFLKRHRDKDNPTSDQVRTWIAEDIGSGKLSKPRRGRVSDPISRHLEALEADAQRLEKKGASTSEIAKVRLAIAALSGKGAAIK